MLHKKWCAQNKYKRFNKGGTLRNTEKYLQF